MFLESYNNDSLSITLWNKRSFFFVAIFLGTVCPKSKEHLFNKLVEKVKTQQERQALISKSKIKNLKILINQTVTQENPFISEKHIKNIFYNKLAHNFSIKDLKKTLKSNLIELGYWKSFIAIDFVDYELTIKIELKEFYKIESLEVKCPDHELQESLTDIFILKKNNISNATINNYKNKALIILKRNGFWNSSVKLFFEKKPKTTLQTCYIHVIVMVEPGLQAKFGKISYSGKYSIKNDLIANQIPFKTGDSWNSLYIYKAKQNLESLGIFKNIQILCGEESLNPFKDSNSKIEQTEIPINIELNEDLKNEVRFIFGLSSQDKITNLTQLQKLNFNTGISLEKKNCLLPYDKINLSCDFDLLKKSCCAEYTYGKLKNFPFDVKATVFLENTNLHSFKPDNTLFHKMLSWSYTLSKDFKNGLTLSNFFGYHWINFLNLQSLKSHDFSYYIYEPLIYSENITGLWLQEKGTIFTLSNKFMYSLQPSNPHLGKLSVFGTLMFPLNQNYSFASKIGMCIHYPLETGQPSEIPKWSSSIPRLRENFCNTDPLLYGGLFHNTRKHESLYFPSTQDFLITSEKNLYIAFEIRRLLNNQFGIAAFYNFKFARLSDPEFLFGIGLRCNAPLGGLILDSGWDTKTNNIFWRLKIGDQF